MKALNTLLCLLLFVALSFNSIAQKKKSRLQPGKMYEPGETLYAPRFGFIAKVPVGWEGILPRESEVFLLSTTTSTYGEIFVFGSEHGDLNTMLKNWNKGVDLSESIRMKAINPSIQDGILSCEITAEGELVNKGNKGFAIARCSPSGPCVTTLMIAPIQFYESVKNTVTEFMTGSTFEPPSNVSPYEDFDWPDFLSDKVLVTYASAEGGSKETMIHLCKDGTFTANIKKKGFFKEQNPSYKGNLSGQWTAKGDGEKATLQFIFTNKSISPIEVPLTIDDEKILSNGERYFVGKSDKCK
jgi:hypothetical protein